MRYLRLEGVFSWMCAFVLAIGLGVGPAYAKKIDDTVVPDAYPETQERGRLEFNGAGIRSKFFFDLYVGSLYLPKKMTDAKAIIQGEEPWMIRLDIISSKITKDKMRDATLEGFENAMGGNLEPIQAEVDAFLKAFDAEIKVGDVFEFEYIPAIGVRAKKNTQELLVVQGETFKQALVGIWLGDEPAQESLRDEMLGK